MVEIPLTALGARPSGFTGSLASLMDALIGPMVSVLSKVAPWLFRNRKRIAAKPRAELERVNRKRTTKALVRRREHMIEAARADGQSVVVGVRRGVPAVAHWDGANKFDTYHYPRGHLDTYRRDVQNGQVPHTRTSCCGSPPKIGTRSR